jgi:RNA recognition motif-containing protein
VGNLAWETSWQDLKDFFATVGNVDRAEVIVGVDGRPKGFGIVRYYNTNDADAAITKLDGAELDGRALHVRFDNKS